MFSSKPASERNNDPEPWVTNDGYGFRFIHEVGGDRSRHDPRPEFQYGKLPANPILVELRQWRGADWARVERHSQQIATVLRWATDPDASSEDTPPWTESERTFAIRVLSLLASLPSEVKA